MTGVNLELLTDPDMHVFVEKGHYVTKRHAKANNAYLKDYDEERESNHVIYLDANNLCGWAMSQSLPTHDFEWLVEEKARILNVTSIAEDGENGYILEVDLKYPSELHDLHNDYPLAPEAFDIKTEMLSPYHKTLLKQFGMKTMGCNKLVPNSYDKTNYVVHYVNLQRYLSLGLRLTRVHTILTFKQSP
jgi:hypothetical protein